MLKDAKRDAIDEKISCVFEIMKGRSENNRKSNIDANSDINNIVS